MPLVLDDLAQRDGATDPQALQAVQQGLNKEYLTYQVIDSSGKVIIHSQEAPATPYDVPLKVGFHDTPKHKIYTESALNGTLFLHVADAFRNRREALREGTVALLWPLLLLIPTSILLIQFIVSRSLAPIDRLRDEIATKDSGNMAAVEGDTLPANCGRLPVPSTCCSEGCGRHWRPNGNLQPTAPTSCARRSPVPWRRHNG